MKGKKVFLSTALAGALAAASAAHAVDVKVYHGSACQAVAAIDAADLITHQPGAFNHLSNTSPLVVVCPIVRDNHANLDGVTVGVRVRSFNGTPLTCNLESRTAFGVSVESDSNSTTSTVATNLLLDINTSTQGGTYSLVCSLPPGGGVDGYRVNEFGSE